MTIIKNGSTGDTLIINDEGHALVLAEEEAEAAHFALLGKTFIISSGFITCSASADTTTAIIYIKNTSTVQDIHIGHLRTCGEVAFKWVMKKGATGLSTENVTTATNTKLNDQSPLVAITYSGAQNATVTGGDQIATWINGVGHSDPNFRGALIIPANQTLTLEAIPFEAVTGGSEACITMECWQD